MKKLFVALLLPAAVFLSGKSFTVDPEKFRSKARNTPFAGRTYKGVIKRTYVGGKLVFQQ